MATLPAQAILLQIFTGNGNYSLLMKAIAIAALAVALYYIIRYMVDYVRSVRRHPLYQAYREMKSAMRQARETERQQGTRQQPQPQQHTRIVPDDEGEYIEFEEVKEDEA